MTARVLDILGLIALLFISMGFLAPILGAIEGAHFPVTSPAQLIISKDDPPPYYRQRWTATAEKLRSGECKFQRVEWFTGNNLGSGVPINALFEDKPQERQEGILVWHDLLIWNPATETREWSHAYVYHQCPWRWWETKTLFYVGEGL